jgi:hypothetical protein
VEHARRLFDAFRLEIRYDRHADTARYHWSTP